VVELRIPHFAHQGYERHQHDVGFGNPGLPSGSHQRHRHRQPRRYNDQRRARYADPGLAAGTPVKVYGVPQTDGTLRTYVLTYFTGEMSIQ
jgi:hypothetical protein